MSRLLVISDVGGDIDTLAWIFMKSDHHDRGATPYQDASVSGFRTPDIAH